MEKIAAVETVLNEQSEKHPDLSTVDLNGKMAVEVKLWPKPNGYHNDFQKIENRFNNIEIK